MERFSNKFVKRAMAEFVVSAIILTIIGHIIYDKMDQWLIESLKESVAQQAQSIAYTLNERFQHKLDELQSRAELLRQNKMPAEDLLDVATIGTKTGRIRGVLREDNSVVAGSPLPEDLFQSVHNVFEEKKQSIDYLHGRGLLFAVPFDYEGQTCIFYEMFSDEAVQNFYKMMSYNGKGTLILAKTYENWIMLSDGLYPEIATDEYPQYDVERYANYNENDVKRLKNFDDTWSELEHSTLVPGKANTFFADNGIDAVFFFCTYISEANHLVLSGYVEWDDVVVGIDSIYTIMRLLFGIILLLTFMGVRYHMKTMEAKYFEHEKALADSANKAKSDFLSSMSHEIRTPINAIMGMDEMILRETKEPATLEYAQNLQHAAKNLLSLINDILDLSKIEAGKMEIIPVEYHLSSVLNDLVNMIQARADKKGLELIVEADNNIPSLLFGDEIRVKQIITNLLTNAVKYTEKGSVTLRVNYLNIDADNIYLCISVSDTGIGIKEEDIKKLFSAFERIEEERNRTIEGTGLGMNITKQLLSMMGAELSVSSVYGQGSNFSFQVAQKVINREPIGDFEEAYRRSLAQREEYHESFKAPNAKILIVDDTPMNLTVIKGLLKQTEIKIDTVESGQECLDMVQKVKYDIIFLDHMMPEMDGIKTLKEMKKLPDNLNEDTPVISLTANAISGAREQYIAAGFKDYLTKPVNCDQLEALIVKYLPSDKISTDIQEDSVNQEIIAGEVDTSNAADHLSDLPEWLKSVEGLNIKEGVAHCGDVEGYLEVLKIYANAVIDGANRIESYYNAEDWLNYTTKVHALKSSSRIIGADELSDKAARLEAAGNADNIDEIRRATPSLLELYRSYADKLKPFIYVEKNGTDKPLINEADLVEAFDAMRDATATFDYDSLMFLLHSLDDYRLPDDAEERCKQIKEAASKLNWELIKEIVN